MIDNTTIGTVIAMILSIAPHILPAKDTSPQQIAKMYAEAEKRAQHILATGDMSDLTELQNLEQELMIGGNQNTLVPIMLDIQKKLVASSKVQPLPDLLAPTNPAP